MIRLQAKLLFFSLSNFSWNLARCCKLHPHLLYCRRICSYLVYNFYKDFPKDVKQNTFSNVRQRLMGFSCIERSLIYHIIYFSFPSSDQNMWHLLQKNMSSITYGYWHMNICIYIYRSTEVFNQILFSWSIFACCPITLALCVMWKALNKKLLHFKIMWSKKLGFILSIYKQRKTKYMQIKVCIQRKKSVRLCCFVHCGQSLDNFVRLLPFVLPLY